MNEQALSQLLEETRAGNRLLKKQLRITRLTALALAALVLVLAVLANGAMREVQTLADRVEQIDIERVADTVARLDVDSLNEAITRLKAQVEALDTEALNGAMQALDEAAGSIGAAADRFNRMTAIFG